MRCSKAEHWVSAGRDGELNEAQQFALREHLTECPACRGFAQRLSWLSNTLSTLPLPEPRPGFPRRFMAKLSDREVTRSFLQEWWRALRPASLAAGGLGLAAGIVMAVAITGERSLPRQAEDPEQRVYADSFDPLPDGSAAAQYVALVHEEGR